MAAGGFGTSGTPGPLPSNGKLKYDDNDNWFDDTSDGSVTAKVRFEDGTSVDAVSSWVIVGPPDYAPPIENLVTVHDLLYDLGLRQLGLDPNLYNSAAQQFNSNFEPSFTDDVYPILRRALDYQWVNKDARRHASSPKFDIAVLAAPPVEVEGDLGALACDPLTLKPSSRGLKGVEQVVATFFGSPELANGHG